LISIQIQIQFKAQTCFEFLFEIVCDPVQVVNMKDVPNILIYLLENFHHFGMPLSIFLRIISDFCVVWKILWNIEKLFLLGPNLKVGPTHEVKPARSSSPTLPPLSHGPRYRCGPPVSPVLSIREITPQISAVMPSPALVAENLAGCRVLSHRPRRLPLRLQSLLTRTLPRATMHRAKH
jgi:hypothetical protein